MQQPTEQDMSRDLAADLRIAVTTHAPMLAFALAAESGWQAAIRRAAAAEAFKAYVHSWLDAAGVPHDPDPQHTAEHGCRIAGRLRWMQARAETAEAEAKQLREALELIHDAYGDDSIDDRDALERIAVLSAAALDGKESP